MAPRMPVRSVHDRCNGRRDGCGTVVGRCQTDSKSHAYAYSPPPDNAALLFHIAVEKLDTVGQGHHREYFETGAARGVVDQPARDRRRLRAHNDLGLACRRIRGPNPLV
jgi:hypothetical protein